MRSATVLPSVLRAPSAPSRLGALLAPSRFRAPLAPSRSGRRRRHDNFVLWNLTIVWWNTLDDRLIGPPASSRATRLSGQGERYALTETRAAEGGVQSVHRALDVLEALAAAGGTASLGDLAAACGLPAPTLHRLAGTLAGRGYLRQLPDRRYSLGSRLVPLGADAHALLGARALPTLRALADLT